LQHVLHLHLYTLGRGSLGATQQNELRKRLASFLGTAASAVQLAELASDASGVQLLATVRQSGKGPAAAAMAAMVDAAGLDVLMVALATALTSHPKSSVEFEYVQIAPPTAPPPLQPDRAPAASLTGDSESAVSDADDEQSQGYLMGVLTVGLPVLVCSLVLALVLSRYVRRVEGRMQKSVMRRLAGVWVRDSSLEMHSTGTAVVVEAVEMQSGVATTVPLPLQAPAAFAGGGGSVIAATTVEPTVAAALFPPPGKVAAETFVHV